MAKHLHEIRDPIHGFIHVDSQERKILGGVLSVLHARGRFCNILCRPRQPQVSPL